MESGASSSLALASACLVSFSSLAWRTPNSMAAWPPRHSQSPIAHRLPIRPRPCANAIPDAMPHHTYAHQEFDVHTHVHTRRLRNRKHACTYHGALCGAFSS